MSSDGGTELSFDPRTWLAGFEGEEPQARPRQPGPKLAAKRTVRPLIAAIAAAAILVTGGATAYATREAPQPVGSANAQQP